MTSSAVLNPGRKMNSRVSASLSRAASSARGHAQFDGLGANFLSIDAAAIVADFDDHLVALMIGVQPDFALCGVCPELAALRPVQCRG